MFKRFHTWFPPAVVALILFVGGIASNWVAADLQDDLEPYHPWVWGAFALALLVTLIMAIRERQAAAGEGPLAGGDFIAGDKIQRDKVGGDAIYADVTESEAVIIGHRNVLTQIQSAVIHLTQQIGPATLSADQIQSVTTAYLEGLVTRYRYLDLKGMGVNDRVALQLPLLEMFVPLRARRELPSGETTARTLRLAGRTVTAEEAAEMGERLSEPIAVLDLLKTYDGVIVRRRVSGGGRPHRSQHYSGLRGERMVGSAERVWLRQPLNRRIDRILHRLPNTINPFQPQSAVVFGSLLQINTTAD